ncbi:MAG: Calx-beta domain-containing protein [Pseudomonadota bacterium]
MLCAVIQAQELTELETLKFTSDIHSTLPADPNATLIVSDDAVYSFDFDSGFAEAVSELGPLDRAGIDGYAEAIPGCARPSAYSLDATASIASQTMRPADVFETNGTIALDGAAAGIPDGVNVDAVSYDPDTCDLILSVDIVAAMNGITFKPDDLIRWDGNSFSLFRVGNFGVNIDALHVLNGGRYLFSMDTDGAVAGLVAQDDDVIESIPGGPGSSQLLAFSPRVLSTTWDPADLVSLFAITAPLGGDFSFTSNRIEIFENAGPLELTVQRANGSEGQVTLDWTTVSDSATFPSDFQPTSGSVVFVDGDNTESFQITINNDALEEGDEQFSVELSIASGDGDIINPSVISVIIIDDETTIFKDSFES